jgi:phytanoyl-CoA hydroxylase
MGNSRAPEGTREQFADRGYVVREHLLSAAEAGEAADALSALVREMHAAARDGVPGVTRGRDEQETRSNYAGVELSREGTGLVVRFEAGVDPSVLSPEDADGAVRVLYGYRDQHPVFERLVNHPAIREVLDALLGPGSLLFQDMALIKPPLIGSEKPWHQDDAYFSWAPVERIVGVWIALDEASAANGCMHVLPGGHAGGGLRHWHSSLDCEIVPGRLEESRAVPVELPPGGALFFSGLLPHRTPPNRSPLRRRALQFHYRAADTRRLEPAEYDTVFVEQDGSPASCRAARPPA